MPAHRLGVDVRAGLAVKWCELRGRGLFIRDATNMGTAIGRRAVRIAVKDGPTNQRMLAMLAAALSEEHGKTALAASAVLTCT